MLADVVPYAADWESEGVPWSFPSAAAGAARAPWRLREPRPRPRERACGEKDPVRDPHVARPHLGRLPGQDADGEARTRLVPWPGGMGAAGRGRAGPTTSTSGGSFALRRPSTGTRCRRRERWCCSRAWGGSPCGTRSPRSCPARQPAGRATAARSSVWSGLRRRVLVTDHLDDGHRERDEDDEHGDSQARGTPRRRTRSRLRGYPLPAPFVGLPTKRVSPQAVRPAIPPGIHAAKNGPHTLRPRAQGGIGSLGTVDEAGYGCIVGRDDGHRPT